MTKISLRLIGIVLIIGIGYGIAKDIVRSQEAPRILFSQESYFSGENGYGTFVDNKGNIYKYDLTEIEWMNEADTYAYLVERYLNTSMKEHIIGKADQADLKRYYSIAKKASASKRKLVSTESVSDVYLGYHRWIAYRYNLAGKIEIVTLYGSGDTEVVSRDKYVKRVVNPVMKMLPILKKEQ